MCYFSELSNRAKLSRAIGCIGRSCFQVFRRQISLQVHSNCPFTDPVVCSLGNLVFFNLN